jgi:ribonuclease BN (tRNA processing enzyme)
MDDWILVLDGGSGLQKFNLRDRTEVKRVDILLTHLHLDHIQGLGFFVPFFDPSLEIHIWGPVSHSHSLHSRLSRYLSPPLFPVLLRDLPCKLVLHEIENSSFNIGPFAVESRYIVHPGPTVGYRISGQHSVFAYLPDHEPALGSTGLNREIKWVSGIDIALNADLLVHDAQYTAEEYKLKLGWGHSSMEDAIKFAALAGVKHLLLSHHDPYRSDIQLTEIFGDLKKRNDYSFKYEPAVEGVTFDLP